VRAHINILHQKNREEETLKKQMGDMALEGDPKKNITLLSYLKQSHGVNELPERIDDTPLIDFPPTFSLLQTKPIFLDLGYSHLEYPNMKSKVKEEEKGMFGKVFGFFKKN